MDKIRFYTLYLPCSDTELAKDVGQIPYTLAKEYNDIVSCIAGCNFHLEEYNVDFWKYVSPIKVKKILNSNLLTLLIFIFKYARKIDILNLYHGGRTNLIIGSLYKLLNSNGHIYLKLDMDYRLCDKYDNSKKERIVFNKNVALADLVSVESEEIRARIQKYTSKKILTLYNGFCEPNFPLHTMQKREKYFLTVGRIGTEQKATDILLQAFAASSSQHDWKLKLIGSVNENFRTYIDKFFEEYPHLKERIIFTGNIKDRQKLYEEYCRAPVFVLPSRWEGFPLVCCEALLCGCFFILSENIPPINELTNHLKYGKVIPVNDVQKLAEALITVSKLDIDQTLRDEMAAYARKHFSWKNNCMYLHEQLLELLN